MSGIQAQLDYVEAVADWFLELGEAHCLKGSLEKGLVYTHIAGTILARQNRVLSSERLELNLQFVAKHLPEGHGLELPMHRRADQKKTCLHVLNEALPAGGRTAMVIRWIKNDQSGQIHNLALLSQQVPVPSAVVQTVSDTGGGIFIANPADSFLQRAVWLRRLVKELATHVILYIDVEDVICGAAFAIDGGPPVLLMNHNAHSFWTGASFVDLVMNCRGSALEGVWTATHRGIPRGVTVPIPLPEPNPLTLLDASVSEVKQEARKVMHIPLDAVVILTVGPSCKYLPIDGLDFLAVFESILKELPDAYLIVVGSELDSRWIKASHRLGGRIRALGALSQSQLARVHDATDVYVEGFPFGTTTALLEAGLRGIPVVLAPSQCPPPYGSDGVALDDIVERLRTLGDYKSRLIRLCRNRDERIFEGGKIRHSVSRHHAGLDWIGYLERAMLRLPREHSTYRLIAPVRTPQVAHEYWSKIATKWGVANEEMVESAVLLALSRGLKPHLTKAAVEAYRHHSRVRRNRTIPLPLLVFLCNSLIPILPKAWGREVFRIFAFLFRGALLSRLRNRLRKSFGESKSPVPPYEEYRQMKAD